MNLTDKELKEITEMTYRIELYVDDLPPHIGFKKFMKKYVRFMNDIVYRLTVRKNSMKQEPKFLHCSSCGKQVSTGFYPVETKTPDKGLIVRAWIECPECLEKRVMNDDLNFIPTSGKEYENNN